MKIFFVFRFAALAILLTFPVELFAVSNRDKECPIVINLDSGWQFRAAGAEKWHPASVPGCVHTDLLNNNLIEDPFFRLNEKSLQWIGETNWEYKSAITLSSNILTRSHIQLLFEGLDTYADVYFNDQLVLKADNMFREWPVEVRALCKPGLKYHPDLLSQCL